MNCASTDSPCQARLRAARLPFVRGPRRRAFTFIELLVAMTITIIFLGSVYVTYMQIRRMHRAVEVRTEAYRNARTALTSLSDELRDLNRLGNDFLLVGLNADAPEGDRRDNDFDGQIDEERVTGYDTDATSLSNPLIDERHAQIGPFLERQLRYGRRDLGDANVDEDVVFGRDGIIFRSFPLTPTENFELKTVTYAVTNFDGRQNVLVRQTRIERSGQPPLIGIAPIAFNVVGFDLLYWNPNAAPQDQYWVETWDSSDVANFNLPRLPLPASIYVRITIKADARPDEAIAPTDGFDTVMLHTVINVEQTIGDILFPRPVL